MILAQLWMIFLVGKWQIQNVHSGEKDRTLFFNKMHQKVNKLRARITIDETYEFE